MANQTNSMAHTKWMCKYHIVFTPKIQKKSNIQSVQRRYQRYYQNLLDFFYMIFRCGIWMIPSDAVFDGTNAGPN